VLKLYKVSKRKHMDISTFAAALLMTQASDNTIADIRIAYGGVGPVVLRLAKTEHYLKGKAISLATFESAGAMALDEITPISDVRGSKDFRLQLAENILQKFFYDVSPEREAALV
jgi:xanthine dehydrogenase small subunit